MAPRRPLLWVTRVLALLAYGAAINYVVWRWRRIVHTSYWMRCVRASCRASSI